ncbi:MAG: MltA domain-containing protein [Caulobacterales bacterium]
MKTRAAALVLTLSLAACATSTTERPTTSTGQPATTSDFRLAPAQFADLPGWQNADLAPALTAFRRQCLSWQGRTPDSMTQGGRYGGPIGAWLPACSAAQAVGPGGERAFFEANFSPALVTGPGEARLTAYYEPVIETSRTPTARLTEPLLRKPNDMITVDIAAFAQAYDSEALRGAPRALTGKLYGDRVQPYPNRSQIAPQSGQVIAYAHPADVYNLQVQGSGRMRSTDGAESRAQFAAQNGYRWNSALGAARNAGKITTANWASFRAYLDANPMETRNTLNADPSYVFFEEQPITDPSAGPRGAANVPLTAMGSIAVDPAFHPYGALIYVDGQYDGAAFDRLLVAQDTGGAIRRGPNRGDIFFGSGPAAGAGAERMNAPARWWTLLPKGTPIASLAHDNARS